jgi:hypothetical protein
MPRRLRMLDGNTYFPVTRFVWIEEPIKYKGARLRGVYYLPVFFNPEKLCTQSRSSSSSIITPVQAI